jgi:hypothetical protein
MAHLSQSCEPADDDEEKERPLFRTKRWTFHSVFVELHKPAIAAAAAEDSGGRVGSTQWLGSYRGAMKRVKEELTEDKTAEINAKLEEWQRQGPDPDVQARYANISLCV